jgi:hypothetical protein
MRDVTLRAGVRPWPFETVTLERALRCAESDAWHSDQRDGFIVVHVGGLDESAESGVGELAPTCARNRNVAQRGARVARTSN